MLISIDLETHLPGTKGAQCPCGAPLTAQEHGALPKPVCMSVVFDTGQEALVTGVPAITETLRALLSTPQTVIAHNGSGFDFPVLAKWCDSAAVQNALRAGRLRCTMLWAQIADFAKGVNHNPNGEHHGDHRGYGLAAIVKRVWAADIAKGEDTWRLRYAELENTPADAWPEAARAYVMNDARLALAIAKSLPDVPDVARKTRQFFWLACSSAKGAYTDKTRAAEWRASLEAASAECVPYLTGAGVLRPNGTRNDAVARARIETALRPELGEYAKLTAKGKISADREACELSADPIMRLYTIYAECQDKLSKEVKTVEQGIVHTRYQLVESGRTSSSKPALQNIGVKSLARRCFMARPGFRYVVTDYGMLELCCMAQLCNVMGCGDTLGAALRAGKDVHTMLALQIDPAGDPLINRRLAKEGNFGRNGGMGWQTLIKTAHKRKVEIDEATAKRIIAAHKKQWPEISGREGYHSKIQDELARTGGLLAHYRSGRLRGGMRFTQGANTLFQGLGSEINLDAFVLLSEEGLMPVLSVHDEYHNEVTSDKEVATIGQICRAVGADWLPYAPPKAEPKIVNDWSEAK